MHISDGVLSLPALAAGWGVTAFGLGVGLKKMDGEKIVRVSLMGSAFFLASLVRVAVGPSTTHLSLLAPIGMVVGWGCFPAMFIALLLQALLFQFGGLIALGPNCFDVAVPALVSYLLFNGAIKASDSPVKTAVLGFISGFFAVLLCALGVGGFLLLTSRSMMGSATATFVTHLPLMAVEGCITAALAVFLKKAAPDMIA